MQDRARGVAAGLVFLGGCLSAAVAHLAAEGMASMGAREAAASEYAHRSVLPLLCGGLIGLVVLAVWAATRGENPLRAQALLAAAVRRLARCGVLSIWRSSFAAGLVVLAGAEAFEQMASLGRVLPGELLAGPAVSMLLVLAAASLAVSLLVRALVAGLWRSAAEAYAHLERCAGRGEGADAIATAYAGILCDGRRRVALGGLTRRGPPALQPL